MLLSQCMVCWHQYLILKFNSFNPFSVSPQVASVHPDSTTHINYTTDAINYQCVSGTQYAVITGYTATFQCTALGIPTPSIAWYRNGTEINSNSDPRVTLNNYTTIQNAVSRTLTLEESHFEDSGSYECRASNDGTPGEDNMEFILIVYGKISRLK